jgi:hypothetical protein
MYVSEDTLFKTSETIKNCPLVWLYDEILDDAYTHDKKESPCGFVPEKAEITSKKLADGRTMLSVMAYVWKRYTGELLSFFKRDGGSKPVSVEMSVYNMKEMANGLVELLDYKFEAITVLGSYVTPAIPGAGANVLSFSTEYEALVRKEFSSTLYSEVDFRIPEKVKSNAKKALKEYKAKGGASSVALAVARHIMNNDFVSPDKARYIFKHVGNKKGFQKNSNEELSFMLMGGKDVIDWSHSICEQMDAIDKETFRYFDETKRGEIMPYGSLKDINPALKGLNSQASMTLAQANAIAKQADAVGADKGGWGIAIKHFKDTHTIENGKWVEKNTNKMEMSMPNEEEKDTAVVVDEVIMATDTQKEEEKESPEEEKAETPSEEKKEDEQGVEKKFAFPENFNLEEMSALFAEEDEDAEEVKMAREELKKGEFADPSVLMSGMFAKMCKMAATVAKMAEDSKVYMSENEELKKFKADVEEKQKMFAVEMTLKELSEKVVIPTEAREEMISEAQKYSMDTIDAWKTFCKAKSFDFAVVKKDGEESVTVVKMGLPFDGTVTKPANDLWA